MMVVRLGGQVAFGALVGCIYFAWRAAHLVLAAHYLVPLSIRHDHPRLGRDER
jgi:hypothetical protein